MPFTVTDFHDLIRLLEVYPDWRAQLLRVLFPEAFLDLPRAVEALAEAQRRTEATLDRLSERMEQGFAEAAANRERIWEAIRESNERMERGFAEAAADRQRIWEAIRESNERMEKGFAEAAADRERIWEAMEKGFAEAAADRERIWEAMEKGFAEAAADRERIWEAMEKGFAEAAAARAAIAAEAAADRRRIREEIRDIKGETRELYYHHRATGIFGRWLRQGHEATNEVADQLQTALQEGRISDCEYTQVLASDLLWGGKLRDTGELLILVLEASWRVGPSDVERAEARAGMLRQAGLKALPVAAGKEWPAEVETLARDQKVAVVQDGSLDAASWQAALEVA